jgi:Flp pilus assembly secretin CpaC
VVRLVLISLSCVAIAVLSSNACAQTAGGGGLSATGANRVGSSQSERPLDGCIEFVRPLRDPLIIELGRSRLLRFPAGVRRVALSNMNSSSVVQINPKEVLLLGLKEGSADLSVWPMGDNSRPTVILIRVQRPVTQEH